MQKNKILSALAVILVLGGLFVFGAELARALFYSPQGAKSVPESVQQTIDIPDGELPDRIVIPSIDLDAETQHVGVGKSGNMAVPSNYSDVGWYRLGTVPGQMGSAVIDGHVDNGFGLSAVFKRLSEMEIGDDVYIITRAGTRLRFEVVEIVAYPYQDVPLDKVFNRVDATRLNLITCTGSWLRSDETYDQRMVVYTKLVEIE